MKTIVILDKEDINCARHGVNTVITKDQEVDIIMTPDAIEELISELARFKEV